MLHEVLPPEVKHWDVILVCIPPLLVAREINVHLLQHQLKK